MNLLVSYTWIQSDCGYCQNLCHAEIKDFSIFISIHLTRLCSHKIFRIRHCSVFFFFFLNSVLRPFQDYFSSYETGQSVGGRKWENPEKNHLAHPQAELFMQERLQLTSQRPSKNESLSSQLHSSQCRFTLVSGVVIASGSELFLAAKQITSSNIYLC